MTSKTAASSGLVDISDLDRALAGQGAFTVLDWMLAEGRLAYADYAAWREGRLEVLDEALSLSAPELDRLLADVERHARSLHLSAEPRELFAWSSTTPAPLQSSRRPEAHRRLLQQWRRERPTPQFDLFMDNAAAATERRLCEAISTLQFDNARRELDALARLDARHKSLGEYQDLINYGRHLQSPPPLDAEEQRAELDGLEREVQPLARALLGASARDYLARAWKRLAAGLLESPQQDSADDRLHAAYALAQVPDWSAVRNALEAEHRLLQRPAWMELLARACRATGQIERGLLWWLARIDRHPQDSAAALEACKDPLLGPLWTAYQDLAEQLRLDPPGAESPSGFAGYVLLKRPGLLLSLGELPPLQQPATLAIVALLEARRAHQDERALRKALSDLGPALLAMYQRVISR